MAADPYKYFRVEARELLEQLGVGVLELERGGANGAEVVARLLRLAHTLKGAARVVKQDEIARVAHEIEDLLAPFRDTEARIPRDGLEAMLGRLDTIGRGVKALSPAPAPQDPVQPSEETFRTLRTDVTEMDELLGGIAETQTRLRALRGRVESLVRARRLASAVAETLGAGGASASVRAGALASDLHVLVVDVERSLAGDTERVERELREVRTAAERLRLLPVRSLFGPLKRTVSDAARSLGKRARFRGEGGDVRLDGHVLGTLQAALVQLVRNSVAHGIELEAARLAAGKPAEGSVVLEVVRRGGRVAFLCSDDGRGIDVAAVRKGLRAKGLLPAETAGPDAEEVLRLLLKGGVSTSAAVTDFSGRGVGLDVVREATARLGGEVSIRMRPGGGTIVEIVVPVSLSSLEALVVEASGARAAIPMDRVVRTLRLAPKDITRSPNGEAVLYDGSSIPFARLGRLLGADGALSPAGAHLSGVVVAGGQGQAAVGVAHFVESATVLVRALPALTPVDPIVAGVWIDEEGNPQPVLDPDRLVESARQTRDAAPRPPAPKAPILVVDDSLTTRMLEQSILESAGYTVELATSGEEAMEKMRRQRYGLLLVDVEMPGIDGFELLELMQSDTDLRHLPVILVTSRASPEDRKRGAEAGAKAYVVKGDFDQGDLLRRIGSLMP